MIERPARFEARATEAQLEDLRRRLDGARWPEPAGAGWAFGTDAEWLRELVAYWREGFDWRRQEEWIASVFPGQRVRVRGIDLHFARIRGRGENPLPLLLLHGWPSCFVEMHHLARALGNAFEVIVPSLPGHGFSSAPTCPLFGADQAADCLRDLMVDVLGHDRFGVHGGDRGAFVAAGLGHRHGGHVAGIHLTLATGIPAAPENRSTEEQTWLEDMAHWQAEEGGYSAIQSTRPLSLAYGLTDSPLGLAAWILEKWRAWSDCGGDPLNCFTREELLTNVMVYWLSGTIYPSMRYYRAHRQSPPAAMRPQRIGVPTGVAMFPKEVMRPPRSAVERKYRLVHWTEMERGGHFPALEAPEALAEDIQIFFRNLR